MPNSSKVTNIPIKQDHRTFEQERRAMLTNLERESSQPNGSKISHHDSTAGSHAISPYHDNWMNEVSRWINSSWRSWDDEMRRMRSSMFSLLPIENFGLASWHGIAAIADPFDLMHRMDREIQEVRNQMGFDDAPFTGSVRDFMKDAYELGDDGQLHFKVRFNTKGFKPEDINVTTSDGNLTVHAKSVSENANMKSSREFCRMVHLPHSIDQTKLQCRLTDDGVLMLEAPVKAPDYQSLTFNDNRQVGIRPKGEVQVRSSPSTKTLAVKGTPGLTIAEADPKNKHIHVEVPVDPIYKPEDLCVNVDSNRVVVTGRHHKVSGDGEHSSKSFAEFSHSYAIPETVDPLTVTAQLIGNTLVVEAPLRK